jgi:hypothetical protein
MFTHLSCHPLTSSHPYQDLQTCLDFGICIGTWSCEDLFYTHVHHKSCHSLTSCHPCQDLQTCLTFGICIDAWACKDLFYTHVRSLVLSSRDIKSSRPGHTNLPGIWHLYCNVIVWRFVLHSCSPTCLVTRWHQVIWTVKQTCLSFGICCGTCSCKDLSSTLGFSNLPADSAFVCLHGCVKVRLHSGSSTCLVTRWHQVIWTRKQTCLSFGICLGTWSCNDLFYTYVHYTCLVILWHQVLLTRAYKLVALSALVLVHDRVKKFLTLMFTRRSCHSLTSSRPDQDIQTCLYFGICKSYFTLMATPLPCHHVTSSHPSWTYKLAFTSGICTILDSKDLFTITLIQWSCHSLTLCLRR